MLNKRPVMMSLLLLLILAAAGAFFAIGTMVSPQAQKELDRLVATPKVKPTISAGKISFAGLYQKTLDPKSIETVSDTVPEPHGLGFVGGALYASSWGDQSIFRIDPATGERKRLADELKGAHDMVGDAEGNLVVTLFKEDRVVKIDTESGKVKQLAGGLSGPNGIARTRDGQYYVTNAKDGTLVKISEQGEVKRIAGGLKEPAGVVVDNDNIVRVAQFADPVNSVIQIQDNGTVQPLLKGLTNAESLRYDESKNLIISHAVNGKAAFSIFFARAEQPQLFLQTDLPGPAVGPVTDGRFLYFESADSSQASVYRIALP